MSVVINNCMRRRRRRCFLFLFISRDVSPVIRLTPPRGVNWSSSAEGPVCFPLEDGTGHSCLGTPVTTVRERVHFNFIQDIFLENYMVFPDSFPAAL